MDFKWKVHYSSIKALNCRLSRNPTMLHIAQEYEIIVQKVSKFLVFTDWFETWQIADKWLNKRWQITDQC